MTVDWSAMVQQVVIAGRPGDVESAALGWEQLLHQVGEVKASLERDVADVGTSWSGPAYEAYKSHILGIAARLGGVMDQARQGGGIAPALHTAAGRLADAQAAMPVPHGMLGELIAARNGEITLGPKFCEVTLTSEVLDNAVTRWAGKATDVAESLIHNVEAAAEKVYTQVNKEYLDLNEQLPESAALHKGIQVDHEELSLATSELSSGLSSTSDFDSGAPYTSSGFSAGHVGAGSGDGRDAWNAGWEHLGDVRPGSDASGFTGSSLAGLGADRFGTPDGRFGGVGAVGGFTGAGQASVRAGQASVRAARVLSAAPVPPPHHRPSCPAAEHWADRSMSPAP